MSSISSFTTRFIKKSISWLFLEIHFLGNFKLDGNFPRKMTFFSKQKQKKWLFLKIILVKGDFFGLFDTFLQKVTFFGKIAFFRKVRILVKGGPNTLKKVLLSKNTFSFSFFWDEKHFSCQMDSKTKVFLCQKHFF